MRVALIVGIPHLWYFGIRRPYDAWRHRDSLKTQPAGLPPRLPYFRSTVILLATLASYSLLTLFLLWLTSPRGPSAGRLFIFGEPVGSVREVWAGFFPGRLPGPVAWLVGAIAYAVIVSIDLPFTRRAVQRGERFSHFSMPQNRSEGFWWIGLSIAAGISEEITWRGVQPELIAQLTGSLWPGVVICSAAFGLGHIMQGWRWAIVTAAFGVMFQALVLLAGSLYVAIAVHIAANITAGLYSGWLNRRGSTLQNSVQ